MSKVFCPARAVDNKGRIVASCSLDVLHTTLDPRHVDMHAGLTWKDRENDD